MYLGVLLTGVYTPRVCSIHDGQKRASDHGLELQRLWVTVWVLTLKPVPLTAEPPLQALLLSDNLWEHSKPNEKLFWNTLYVDF